MSTEKEDVGVLAFGCVGLIPAVIFGYILRGWALVTLWAWFVTPVFNIQPPSYALALGLGIFGGMITGTSDTESPGNSEKSAKQIMYSVYGKILLRAPLAVGIGWIVKHWV